MSSESVARLTFDELDDRELEGRLLEFVSPRYHEVLVALEIETYRLGGPDEVFDALLTTPEGALICRVLDAVEYSVVAPTLPR